jgi:7,8-dihydropterin-6-yl-methyl-4-(beta-D-ribofuranosyl)aminobenzene 5'-phosphate synthase
VPPFGVVTDNYHFAPAQAARSATPHKEDYLRQTLKELVDLDVDYTIPVHCTGEPFYEMLKAEMPKKVIRSYTGTKLAFGA